MFIFHQYFYQVKILKLTSLLLEMKLLFKHTRFKYMCLKLNKYDRYIHPLVDNFMWVKMSIQYLQCMQ